ncbi:hypothetical protein [Bradyrhizobium sp. RT4b]|uniref:hypothetical protein n=1 Tax=unclassified Bradyrhizobium TaxID=2631580 RepID=UPI003392C9E5
MIKQERYPFNELQGEILRSIFRINNPPGGRLLSASGLRGLEAQKTTAAQLLAAPNGWQYQLYPRWDHLEPLVPCPYAREHLRYALSQSLFFVDMNDHIVAIATQPHRLEDSLLEQRLNLLRSHGLFLKAAPSTYASIDDPGNRRFIICTSKNIGVHWLPEQNEIDGPFAVSSNEMPSFHDFLDQLNSSNAELAAAMEVLQSYRDRSRRWAPPEHIVSQRHFEAYLYNVPWSEAPRELTGAIWAVFTAWSREQVTQILTFDRELGS